MKTKFVRVEDQVQVKKTTDGHVTPCCGSTMVYSMGSGIYMCYECRKLVIESDMVPPPKPPERPVKCHKCKVSLLDVSARRYEIERKGVFFFHDACVPKTLRLAFNMPGGRRIQHGTAWLAIRNM